MTTESTIVVLMCKDQTLIDRVNSRARNAVAAAGGLVDKALGWAVDYRDLIFGGETLSQAWVTDVQARAIGGAVPITDAAIDGAITAAAELVPFPMPPAPSEDGESGGAQS